MTSGEKDKQKQEKDAGENRLQRFVTNQFTQLGLFLVSVGGFGMNFISDHPVVRTFAMAAVLACTVCIGTLALPSWLSGRRRVADCKRRHQEEMEKTLQQLDDQLAQCKVQQHLKTEKLVLTKISYEYDLKNCYADVQSRIIDNHHTLKTATANLCTHIEQALRIILNEKLSVCIKLIETESLLDKNADEWKIRTLCRGNATNKERFRGDAKPVLIKDNSDFEMIIQGERVFAIPDLIEYKKANPQYKNSTRNFERHYKSTIVAPICIEIDKISPLIRERISLPQVDAHILGFLCIDSLATFAQREEDFVLATHYATMFAETLYHLLECFLVNQMTSLSYTQNPDPHPAPAAQTDPD